MSAFNQIEARGIKFVTLEQAFSGKEAIELQRPQQKYKNWIGEVTYDNANGGRQLLDALLHQHRIRHPDVPPSITGIGGNFDNLSVTREKVLRELDKDDGIHVNQVFPSYWDPVNIATNFENMLKRYPHTNIFWCAGDQLALETLKQYQRLFKTPIIVGGFDWLPTALLKIQQGEMTASVGGHFLMGAIAITNIFDYQQGIDRFSSDYKPYDFEVVTKVNVDSYLDFMQQQKWQKVDFNRFSVFKMGSAAQALTMQNIVKPINAYLQN